MRIGRPAFVKAERRVDLRLIVPVLIVWPVVAFWGLLVSPVLVVVAAVASGVAAGVVLLSDRGASRSPEPRWTRRPRITRTGQASRLVALTLALLAFLLAATAGHRALRAVGPVEELATQRAVVTLRGQVAADPRPIRGGVWAEGETPMVAVRLSVDRVVGRGAATTVQTPVLVLGRDGWSDLEWHERIEVVARLAPSEPGDDVVAVATPSGAVRVTGGPGPVFEAASTVRERFRAATNHLPTDAQGLVPALVIGDTSRTPGDLTDAMLDTGMSHLSAVSGSNVTLVLIAAMGLCGLIGLTRRQRPWVAFAVLVGFVVLARPEPSVIRAAVMGSVGLLALSASRRQSGVPALAGAVVLLMAWDPWLSRSFGFALSSVATLGLLLFAQPWGRSISRRLPRRLSGLGTVIAVPVAAQAVCAPIVVPLQGDVSLIAVVANLLAAPLVGPTTIAGVATALVSVVWIGAAAWVSWLAAMPALGIAWVARTCAEAPFGSIPWGDSAASAVVLAVATAAVIAVSPWLWHRSRTRPPLAVAVTLLVSAFAMPTAPISWPPPGWVMVACDVGQGDGLVIAVAHGRAVVIDSGLEPEPIDDCLDRLEVTTVDALVLTHFHADHVGGVAGVLTGRTVTEILASPVRDPPGQFDRVARLAAEARVPIRDLWAGDQWVGDGVTADVWWPARQIDEGSVANNGSVVMTARVRGVDILLAGDIEREAAGQVLLAARRDPTRWAEVDVLKVAHHGSSNRDDRLLDHVGGRLAVISVGADNDYGHPSPSTLKSLQDKGFRVARTDADGDVAVVVSNGVITIRTRGSS